MISVKVTNHLTYALIANSYLLIEFRLEWSKACARAARWKEEVRLLKEEMRRVLTYLRWKSNDWLDNGDPRAITLLAKSPDHLEGLHAYACRQANVYIDLHDHFLGIWSGLELPREYLTEPDHPLDLHSDVMEMDRDDI
jgi:hypothetical protein